MKTEIPDEITAKSDFGKELFDRILLATGRFVLMGYDTRTRQLIVDDDYDCYHRLPVDCTLEQLMQWIEDQYKELFVSKGMDQAREQMRTALGIEDQLPNL